MVNIKEWVRNFPKTVKLYLSDPYLRWAKAKVLGIVRERGPKFYVVLNESIFHPRGGGQPSDAGFIKLGESVLEVKKVLDVGGVLAHYSRLVEGEGVDVGDVVLCELNWRLRYTVMKLHTAGHILDYAVQAVYGRVVDTLGAFHGPPNPYVEYVAEPPTRGMLQKIEEVANRVVRGGRPVRFLTVPKGELPKAVFNAPNLARIPGANEYRIVVIEGINGIPCTGTHVRNTKEVGRVLVTDVVRKGKYFRLHYTVEDAQ